MNGPSSPPRVGSVVMNAPVILQHEYLEAVTNAYMTSGILVTESKEVPHFRYTDGKTYLREAPSPETAENLGQWSSSSPVNQAHGFELSDDEGHFAVSYLAKQLEGNAECSSVLPRSRNETRGSSALALARKITMANNRRKAAALAAEETEHQASASLIPRTPVQPYPYFPWQPKGDCLSSTKARLYESKPVKDQELKKLLSQMSLEERKAKKASRKNFARKQVVSALAVDRKSLQTTDDHQGKETESKQFDGHVVENQSSTPAQPQSLLVPSPMKKYTDDVEEPPNRITTGLDASTSSHISNTPLPKSNSALNDIPQGASRSNQTLVSGRHSPVYVAVPVDKPPMKVKLKGRAFAHDISDISTINKLRNKLTNDNQLGKKVTHSAQKPAGPGSSSSERENEPVTPEKDSFTIPSRSNKRETSGVTMATGSMITWTNDSIHHAGLVTENRGRKYQSPDMWPGMSQIGKGLGEGCLISSDCKKFITHHKAAGKPLTNQEPGVVQIGKELGDDGPISEDHRRATTRHKAAGNPPKNQELGTAASTISLTFQFSSGVTPREQNQSVAFPAQSKNFTRPNAQSNR